MAASEIHTLTTKVRRVMEEYKKSYPDVKMDKDYIPFKITEEWGECLQAYLMLTDRGRQKGKTKEAIKEEFSKEMADIFGYLLAFADQEGIDLSKALTDKWFSYLKD